MAAVGFLEHSSKNYIGFLKVEALGRTWQLYFVDIRNFASLVVLVQGKRNQVHFDSRRDISQV